MYLKDLRFETNLELVSRFVAISHLPKLMVKKKLKDNWINTTRIISTRQKVLLSLAGNAYTLVDCSHSRNRDWVVLSLGCTFIHCNAFLSLGTIIIFDTHTRKSPLLLWVWVGGKVEFDLL